MKYVFLMMVMTISCNHITGKSEHQNNDIQEKFILIRDNLYKDALGNLYFKTMDKSDPKSIKPRYLDVVYSKNFGNDGIRKLKDIIDPESFQYNLQKNRYEDINHKYIFKEMVDGGTLTIED